MCDLRLVALYNVHALGFYSRGAEGKKKSDAPTYLRFLRFFEIFRSDFRKYFYGVFRLPVQRNGQKREKTNRWEKTKEKKGFFFSIFSAKSF
jgi:hypothetical protein